MASFLVHSIPLDGVMPRYFFNTRIGDELIDDPEGDELRNLDRAWEVARAMIREVLRIEGAQPGGPTLFDRLALVAPRRRRG